MFKVTKLNVAICNAAREQGAGQRTVIKLIKSGKVNWSDEPTVENMRQAYFIGMLAGGLDLESNDQAERVLNKKPYNKLAKDPSADTYRTPEEQRIFRKPGLFYALKTQ